MRRIGLALVTVTCGCTADPGAGEDASAPPPDAAIAAVPDGGDDCPPIAPRGMWVWDDVVGDAAATAALFDFAAARGVTALYLHAEGPVEDAPDALAELVAGARERCLDVELLFGAADWALAGEHARPLELAAAAAALPPAGKPAALHYDVEPYGLAEWDGDREAIANQYLDLLEELAAATAAGGLPLHVDVPFWFDGVVVTRGGAARPLSELVLDRVDRAVLMDYSDDPDAIVERAATEVAYAGAAGREIVLGVETMCGLEPESVSFCEEGGAAMEAALAHTLEAYAGAPGFAGVAVHHYGSWSTLVP